MLAFGMLDVKKTVHSFADFRSVIEQNPNPGGNPQNKGKEENRENWGLDNYRKNDPQALAKDPELYNRLYEREFGKK